jgi:hypothetical protein
VIKYIPSDIVAGWVAVSGMVKGANNVPKATTMWVAFAVGVFLTAAWTWKQTSELGRPPALRQISVSTAAFIVWVVALGAPFDSLPAYHPLFASMILVAYTLLVGLLDQ